MMMAVLVMLCVFSMCLQAVHSQEQPLCAADEWKCGNDNCINIGSRCNGEDDCSDDSDEQNCIYVNVGTAHWKCPSSKWKCSNGLCVYLDWRCDGTDNCGDNSDENNCDTWRCDESLLWKCNSSNQCTWQVLRCYGDPRCRDKSDEKNCAQWQCPVDTWACANRSRCIWRYSRCDGKNDCHDGSDEDKCETWTCPANTWRCNNQRCISTIMRCDGKDQCGDGSDELDCVTPSLAPPREAETLTVGAIAGIVVGGLLLTLLLIVFTVLGIKKRKQQRKGTSRLHNTDNPNPELASRALSPRTQHPEQQSSCEEHVYQNTNDRNTYDVLQRDQQDDGMTYTELVTSSGAGETK